MGINNFRLIVAILVAIAVAGSGLWYVTSRSDYEFMPATTAPFEMFGNVSSLDQAGNKIQVRTSSGADKTVLVGYGTKIIKRLSVPTSGGGTNYTSREINIGDLEVGNSLIVGYRAESAGVLTDVVQVYAGEESKEDLEKRTPQGLLLSAGKITTFDSASRTLSYEVASLITKQTSVSTRVLAEGAKIYLVLDQSRAHILHARISATESDLQPGRVLFITPEALIVSMSTL